MPGFPRRPLTDSLKAFAEQALTHALKNCSDASQLRKFLGAYDLQWGKQVARHTLETLRIAKWNKNGNMPAAEDIKTMQRFLEAEMKQKSQDLKS